MNKFYYSNPEGNAFFHVIRHSNGTLYPAINARSEFDPNFFCYVLSAETVNCKTLNIIDGMKHLILYNADSPIPYPGFILMKYVFQNETIIFQDVEESDIGLLPTIDKYLSE